MWKWLFIFFISFSNSFASAQSIPDFTEKMAQTEVKKFSGVLNYDLYSVSSNNFDVHYYRCEWSVDPAIRYISGAVTSYFTITSSTHIITYDLANALTVDSVVYHGSRISFSQTPNNGLQVTFPLSLNTAQKDSVSIFYKGIPPNTGAFALSMHNGVPVQWTLSEPYGARTWWPCKDVLVDKADSIDIIITYPATYTSSSNGMPVNETISADKKTTVWRHRYPIVAYLVAFAITNYVINTDAANLPSRQMPLAMYSYPEAVATFIPATSTAKFCLEKFSSLITEYPFSNERYAQTQFNFGGGMEHQTNSFIGSPLDRLVAHELAHQWFGNKVTNGSWSDLWLNEGFATYMELVYTELRNPAGRQTQLQGWRNSITSNPGGSVYVSDTLNINRLFDGRLTYRKGGYLLHMLRWKLGDSTFFRGIRRYITDPQIAYKTARAADLQRNLEAESNQNLTEFFKDWLYGEGYPDYSTEWTQRTNLTVAVKLSQVSSHPSVNFFEMRVPLLFRSATRDTVITVNHTRNEQAFVVNPGFVVDTLIIDPQLWILTKNKISKKVPDIGVSEEVLVYPNPATTRLSIHLPGTASGELRIQLFNAVGQEVYAERASGTATRLDINTQRLASGIYWLRLTDTTNFKLIRKILILRR